MYSKDVKLVGIKSIASFLGISERTVFRWEKDLGLPLYRVDGNIGHTVYAFKEELDTFVSQKNSNFSQRLINTIFLAQKPFRLVLSIILLIVLGLAAFVAFRNIADDHNDYSPVSAVKNGKYVQILGEKGNVLWSIEFANTMFDQTKYHRMQFEDVDGDGKNEVLGFVYKEGSTTSYLTLFDDSGEILWRTSPKVDQTYDGLAFQNYFFADSLKLLRNERGEYRIVVVWRHEKRFFSMISSYNIEGDELNKYYHAGAVGNFRVLETFGGRHNILIFQGMNNLLNGEGVVFALALDHFNGVSPPYSIVPEYAHEAARLKIFIPDNPEVGDQLFFLRFKRPEILKEYQPVYESSVVDDADSDMICIDSHLWEVVEGGRDITFGFIYYLDSNLRIRSIVPDTGTLSHLPGLLKENNLGDSAQDVIKIASNIVHYWKGGKWIALGVAE